MKMKLHILGLVFIVVILDQVESRAKKNYKDVVECFGDDHDDSILSKSPKEQLPRVRISAGLYDPKRPIAQRLACARALKRAEEAFKPAEEGSNGVLNRLLFDALRKDIIPNLLQSLENGFNDREITAFNNAMKYYLEQITILMNVLEREKMAYTRG